jgi:acyl-CoA synthetase (AMP-forming)/AMP-acid ligase II
VRSAPLNQHRLTIPGIAAAAAEIFGEAVALIAGGEVWSFERLYYEARRAASAFLACGVKTGDTVALWAPNRREWVVAALGAQMAGAAIVPINTRLKGRETADILRRARVTMLLSAGTFLGTHYPSLLEREPLPALRRRVVFDDTGPDSWDAFLQQSRGVEDPAVDAALAAVHPDTLSDIIFTSGTTGAPKGVLSTHGQVVELFRTWVDTVTLRTGDRYLIVNPFFHTFGYKAGWVACLIVGATMLPVPVFDAAEATRLIAEERITFLPGPPTLFQALLAQQATQARDLSSLRVAVTGAATVAPKLIERMYCELGIQSILTGYGMTECGTITLCRPGDSIERIANTCGRAIPGLEIRCLGDDGREAPCGELGEILVRGYGVMQGYLDDPAATAEAIDADGWLHTGDVGVLDSDGYLRITDRKKDLYICGGFNCYPAEIEKLLCDHPAIEAAAVIGVPDERLGEVGRAFVILRPGQAIDAGQIIEWARGHMANYKVPRHVELCQELPRNAAGKVLRTELRNRSGSLP